MTFNDDRRSEAPAAPHEFPQAWWTVLHATHGAPREFQASRPRVEVSVGNARSCRFVSVDPDQLATV